MPYPSYGTGYIYIVRIYMQRLKGLKIESLSIISIDRSTIFWIESSLFVGFLFTYFYVQRARSRFLMYFDNVWYTDVFSTAVNVVQNDLDF